MRLVEASGCGPTPLNGDDVEEQGIGFSALELERNDPYCKLSYAQHPDIIASEIVNFKGFTIFWFIEVVTYIKCLAC